MSSGSFYAFRTRNCTINADDKECAEIYWNGDWQLVDYNNSADCRGAQGTAHCSVEEFTEVYSEQATPHPDLTASSPNRIDWRNTELRTDPGSWISWTRPSTKGAQTAYDACGIDNYYRFYALKGSC